MTEPATRSVIIEKEYAHPPEKVWRALTERSLIEQWLMKNDFQPLVGHEFRLRSEPVPNWDGVIECRVLAAEPCKTLSYTWGTLGTGTVVTFTLTPTAAGTHLRMEHSGFREDQEKNYKGAKYGWQSFLGKLEGVVAGLE
ncbi:MAG TPA: SRPBCC domain-containing protein [Acidobacteriaceae bacterium]|nr:SRPBCC domain-containing protein [Acidobacteriaceae bacterium]